MTVDIGATGTLSSATRDELLDEGANLALIGSEIIQFRTATLGAAGIYTLSGLLRGRRGTEWAAETEHEVGEEFTLLRTAGTLRVPRTLDDERARAAYWQALTAGQLTTDGSVLNEWTASECLRPFTPVDLRVDRSTPGTARITWTRRSRYRAGEMIDGSDVPLAQSSELYCVTAYTSDGNGGIRPMRSPESFRRGA